MHKEDNIVIGESNGRPIIADLTYEKNGKPKPVVIFSHGFKGFKDWGHFNHVAKVFAEAGFVFVKYNFSHNGTTPENPMEFGDLEAFGNNNLLMELEEVQQVIDYVLSNEELSDEIDTEKVHLMGHSRGGGISILAAAKDARISKIVGWAAVGEFDSRVPKVAGARWEREGVMYVPNSRTNIDMPVYYQFYRSYYDNYDELHIPNAVISLNKPVLLIQGTEDEAVSIDEAKEMKRLNDEIKLKLIEGAGHTFGVRHPFVIEDISMFANDVIETSIDFFKAKI
jgi:pimeloyl-ACP methyl ester carboxylesterase